MIELKNLTKIYQLPSHQTIALDDISLSLPEKGFVMILGPSGCGKSTLLNILGGLDFQTSGQLIINEVDTKTFEKNDWDSYRNQEVGFVFQNYYLLPHLSVFDNIALTLDICRDKQNRDKKVYKALEMVGLTKKAKNKPHQLSGGQRQKVAIARAIISNPSIILADEPTGALDSKSATQILAILKTISKDQLVVMVTHNKEFANKYADHIIELLDGKVIKKPDESSLTKINNKKELKKSKIPLKSIFNWAIKNLWNKKIRSAFTVLAGAVGLVGVGLILSMSSGLNDYLKDAQSASLGKYPVQVYSYLDTSFESQKEDWEEYPVINDEILLETGDTYEYETINALPTDFIKYMNNIDKSNYSVVDTNSYVRFPLYTMKNETCVSVDSSYCYKMVKDMDFISSQYDCIAGRLPQATNELLLVVDTYNGISVSTLERYGFNVKDSNNKYLKSISVNDILNKEYKYIENDKYYIYNPGDDKYYINGNNDHLYSLSSYNMNVVGILRQKKHSHSPIYGTSLLYTSDFNDYVIDNANHSEIVLKQLSYGYSKSVFSGQEIVEQISETSSGTYTYSKEYYYKSILFQLGQFENITSMYFYTPDFASRLAINNYVKAYNLPEDSKVDIKCYDFIENVTDEFSSLVNVFSNILYIFSFICIFVSAVLNAILTYVNVLQRKNEIGLLRSLGARKVDIIYMIEAEAISSGLFSGLLGSILSVVLNSPISQLVKYIASFYDSSVTRAASLNLSSFNWWVIPLLFAISLIVNILASLIPSIMGAKKAPVDALANSL